MVCSYGCGKVLRHQADNIPSEVRVQPTNPIIPQHYVTRRERVRSRELENDTIHDRPHRLHKIEHQGLLLAIGTMEIPDERIEPSCEYGNSDLAHGNLIRKVNKLDHSTSNEGVA